jgi:hypothetical protein
MVLRVAGSYKMDSSSLVKGSILDVAASGKPLPVTMMEANKVVIVDCSLSMEQKDAQGNRSRDEVAREVLSKIQSDYPGQLVIISFNDKVELCLDGNIMKPAGDTHMVKALEKAKSFLGAKKDFIFISDGLPNPDSWDSVYEAADAFKGRMDVIYIGPDVQVFGSGKDFLMSLAKRVNGSYSEGTLAHPEIFEDNLKTLLLPKSI